MKKAGQLNYLNEDKDSLLIAPDNIKGVHILPFDWRGVANQL